MYERNTIEPEWVCMWCADRRGASMQEGHLATFNFNVCGICGVIKSVTHPRDFGKDRHKLKVTGEVTGK